MIIHNAEYIEIGDDIEISAQFEFHKALSNIPEKLWFRFPRQYRNWVSTRSDAIMAGGLDLYLEDRQNFEETFCIYEDLLRQLDIPLIKAATNIYSFSEYRINWRLFYSPATVSLGHLLSRRVKKFLLPTTGQAGVVRYYGSSTPVTYLFGSETVGVINHGFGVDRMTKLDALMDWPVSHHVLRVCSDKTRMKGSQNCSRCHKCYPAKMWIQLNAEQDKYSNFDYQMKLWDYFHWGSQPVIGEKRVYKIKKLAFDQKRYLTAALITIVLIVHWLRIKVVGAVFSLIKPEWIYTLKRLMYQSGKKYRKSRLI